MTKHAAKLDTQTADDHRIVTASRFFQTLGDADYDAFFALWAEDGVFEMPYLPPDMPGRQQGVAAIKIFYRGVRDGMRTSHNDLDRFILAADPLVLIAEGRGTAVLTNGRSYNNRYLWIFTFNKDGRVASLREYADPQAITAAFAPAAGT